MADISSLLNKIKSAVRGDEVRDSIHDAIEAMNTESSAAMEGFKINNERFTALITVGFPVDSELMDIRVGYDGTLYPTAGDAVRTQFNNLKMDEDELREKLSGGDIDG